VVQSDRTDEVSVLEAEEVMALKAASVFLSLSHLYVANTRTLNSDDTAVAGIEHLYR